MDTTAGASTASPQQTTDADDEQGESRMVELLLERGERLGRQSGFQSFRAACELSILETGARLELPPCPVKTRNPAWNARVVFLTPAVGTIRLTFYNVAKDKKKPLGFTAVEVAEAVANAPLPIRLSPLLRDPSHSGARVFFTLRVLASTSQQVATVDVEDSPDEDASTTTGSVAATATAAAAPDEETSRRMLYEARRPVTEVDEGRVREEIDDLDSGLRAHFHGRGEEKAATDELPEGWDMQIAPNGRPFFIDHRSRRTTWTDPRDAASGDAALGPLPAGWEQRVHSDGRLFFVDHVNRTTQWEDPRFESAAAAATAAATASQGASGSGTPITSKAVPYSRDFKLKVDYLRSRLPRAPSGKCELSVRRATVLQDSFTQIMKKSGADLRAKLWISFSDETGLDYGGVAREWCFLLGRQLFHPQLGLFRYAATNNYTLQVNPHAARCQPEHESLFWFVGRLLGIAIYHGKLLDAFFVRPFYKQLLGKRVALADLESVDQQYYNSLVYIKENDPSDLELTFSVTEEVLGEVRCEELCEGGKDLAVNEENKHRYVDLVVDWLLVKRNRTQMDAVIKGLHEVIPSTLLSLFDASDLELLLCGLEQIDVVDWRRHTHYKGGFASNSQVIHWFWRCVAGWDGEQRARLLQWVTGTSRVPMNGFRELQGAQGPQRFTIEKWGNSDMLPRAHTCFNRLDLPPYKHFSDLRQKLLTAIENSEIFSGVD